ncbi:MAG: hypothetical protein LRY32_01340 [Flavobacterium sp.]|nr:hypothetical protein [Flavobacterium sp.]
MGTWGTGILSSDFSSDIYDDFFSLYNEGKNVKEITEILVNENKETLIELSNDACEFWLVLALAQWECRALEESVFNKVKNIVETKEILSYWKEENAYNFRHKKERKGFR